MSKYGVITHIIKIAMTKYATLLCERRYKYLSTWHLGIIWFSMRMDSFAHDVFQHEYYIDNIPMQT